MINCNNLVTFQEGEEPLKYGLNLPKLGSDSKIDKSKESSKFCQITREIDYEPNMEDFLISMKQLMTNPILTCNNLSAVFYILGASVYMTFMTKYMEVLFGISAAGSSMISGMLIDYKKIQYNIGPSTLAVSKIFVPVPLILFVYFTTKIHIQLRLETII